MTGKTHASCGIFVGALAIEYYKTDLFTSVTIVVLAVIASLLPDICHTQSKIGRKIRIISFFIRLLFGHRTFTHSILFIVIIGLGLYVIQTPQYYFVTIITGLISHVILDMLTPKGVKLFYPIPLTVKLPITFKTGGLVDLSLASALIIGSLYTLFKSNIDDLIKYFISY
ncbi:metal-dependent hydrolase [Staphylococcus sp. 18_1_E_LY]|uniref:Metal-dependent hydrolase n=1 Tax=Staphylococcus lloydii TaxID=2781774 RepID=A0A7T1FAL1_9STAP|nr:metal-dependent hydrolase [Staphylococcus lloydii]MBF7020520.1 metal-dependent hydrolase [Staphylococcus lloydii]MBF7028203.1 metal-dependent hydrolase [Staphylococcus lloydii]QPM75865.1 metal-dependent hydrolase [Staphylococcus lloydii]